MPGLSFECVFMYISWGLVCFSDAGGSLMIRYFASASVDFPSTGCLAGFLLRAASGERLILPLTKSSAFLLLQSQPGLPAPGMLTAVVLAEKEEGLSPPLQGGTLGMLLRP